MVMCSSPRVDSQYVNCCLTMFGLFERFITSSKRQFSLIRSAKLLLRQCRLVEHCVLILHNGNVASTVGFVFWYLCIYFAEIPFHFHLPTPLEENFSKKNRQSFSILYEPAKFIAKLYQLGASYQTKTKITCETTYVQQNEGKEK